MVCLYDCNRFFKSFNVHHLKIRTLTATACNWKGIIVSPLIIKILPKKSQRISNYVSWSINGAALPSICLASWLLHTSSLHRYHTYLIFYVSYASYVCMYHMYMYPHQSTTQVSYFLVIFCIIRSYPIISDISCVYLL